ncbi:MAG: tetratricopeptide repeat protein [bacterium]
MSNQSKIAIVLVILVVAVLTSVSLRSPETSDPVVANLAQQKKHFVGSQACQACHEDEYQQWRQSDHFKAMQKANADAVLGDFSDVKLEFHGVQSRLYQQNDQYLIDTDDADGNRATFEIKNTFGFHPLQQYLVELDDGHVQALNIAWDSRAKDKGGQRWFHLQPNELITPNHPFYWTNHFQSWNSRCADCHSTNVERNYNSIDHSFDTTFSEINVGCEACHGEGSLHVSLAESGELLSDSGFDREPASALSWGFSEGKDIAEPRGTKNSDSLDMCGSCHALRGQLTNTRAGGDFHDLNRLQLINETTYFADGQSKEEAFVVGSFLQSKMHHKGVTCSNCHNPHTGKVLAQSNSLCAQCHKPEVFDTSDHHHHESNSPGAACINCHMPERTFMQVDKRRDHSFTIPRPKLSLDLGVPNACTQCHTDKDDKWANQHTNEWGVNSSEEHWAYIVRRATQNDSLVTRPAVEAILNTGLPDLIRASLLEHLAPMPSRVSAEVARKSMYDKSPLVRRAGVLSLQGHPAELRWQVLSAFLDDSSRSVRIQIAESLSDITDHVPQQHLDSVSRLIEEYRQSLLVSADSVTTQLNLANLDVRLGDLDNAEQAYQRALTIEPRFVPALLSLAEFYRRTDKNVEEKELLDRALEVAPDDGATQHGMGLFHVRNKDYALALSFLKKAVEQDNASPYYAYVYAVALENQGRLAEAIDSLKAADQRWPNQFELLSTLILYLEESGDQQSVYPYLSKLSAIAPASPQVKQLIDKYRASGQ